MLILSARSDVIDSGWYQCAKYPLPTTNNTDAMCRMFFIRAAIWAREDPAIGKLMIEDLAEYIRETRARHGAPEGWDLFFWRLEEDGQGVRRPMQGWREDEHIQAYLQTNGITVSE